MRVLHVVHQFFPERVGGTEVYTLGLVKGLIERGYQATVFHRSPGPPGLDHTTWKGVPTYRACAGPMTPWSVFRATFGDRDLEDAFAKVLAEFRPGLIHWQHLMGLPVSLVAQAYRERIPSVLTLHDYWIICANAQLLTNYDHSLCHGPRNGGMNCARCAIARARVPFLWPGLPILIPLFLKRRQLLRRALDKVALVIAPSRFLEQQVITWGIPADRLLHIPNGIDVAGVRPRSARNDRGKRFAYIGGLAPQKGVHVLVEAFTDLGRDATLEVYGDSTQFPDYHRQLRAMAHSPQVVFGGRLDRNGVWKVLSEVDALMVPSVWYENAPVIIQEAFAAGVPVVASNLGALAEWVDDGVDGLLALPDDVIDWRTTLRRLVDEPGLLARLQANVNPPTVFEEHLDRLELLYTQLVKGDPTIG